RLPTGARGGRGGTGLSVAAMKVLHLMSCRGWSSDAYWAARVSSELTRRGHDVTLGCRGGTEDRVIERARREGVEQIETFAFGSGARPGLDVPDVRRLSAWLPMRRGRRRPRCARGWARFRGSHWSA